MLPVSPINIFPDLWKHEVVNVIFAGLGGQGVLKASDMLAEVAFRAGLDVKKSEVHGMSQRGGSVSSHLRYGDRAASPIFIKIVQFLEKRITGYTI